MKLQLSQVPRLTWKGLTATLPALLLSAVFGWVVCIVVDVRIVGDPGGLPGWPGLQLMVASMSLQALLMMLPDLLCMALLLNALGDGRLSPGDIMGRAVRAIPTAIALSSLKMLISVVGALPGYFIEPVGWTPWIAAKAAAVVSAGMVAFIGYAVSDAIARRIGVLGAMAGSLEVTRGHRWTLFAITLVAIQLVDEISVWTGGSIDSWLTVNEMTEMGARPVMAAVWTLGGVVLTPLSVAIYVQLRRLHEEAGPSGLAATFE